MDSFLDTLRKSSDFSNTFFFLTSPSESSGYFNCRFKVNFLHSLSEKSRQTFSIIRRTPQGNLLDVSRRIVSIFFGRLMVKCLDISLVVHSDFSPQYFEIFVVNSFDIMYRKQCRWHLKNGIQ
jgi:hypothetical protein